MIRIEIRTACNVMGLQGGRDGVKENFGEKNYERRNREGKEEGSRER